MTHRTSLAGGHDLLVVVDVERGGGVPVVGRLAEQAEPASGEEAAAYVRALLSELRSR